MSPSNEEYRIDIKERLKDNWEGLEKEVPAAMERCMKFLKKSPESRLESGGKLKKLKGRRFKGILQYDITDEARVWYRVDRKQHIVKIEYVGHHP